MSQTKSLPKGVCHPAIASLTKLQELASSSATPDPVRQGIQDTLESVVLREEYSEEVSTKNDTVKKIHDFTWSHDWEEVFKAGKSRRVLTPRMMSGLYEGSFLKMLVAMTRTKHVLELGMYTGSSAISMASALPADGTLVTCDREEYLRDVAQKFFDSVPYGKKIQIRIGDVQEILEKLSAESRKFDLIFMDADKPGYLRFYKFIMDTGLLAPGGTIAVDNAFWAGSSYKEDKTNPETCPVGHFTDFVVKDDRVEQVMVPIRDGVLLIRRKEDMNGDN